MPNLRRSRAIQLVLSLALTGCASTVVIRADEPTLQTMVKRLEATRARVEALAPEPDERALFMQAEGFYRYRLPTPDMATAGYLVQALAVITELPAFQELSGALDIGYLRLQTHDGAVQLWETQLAKHPHGVLRPLTLYRLGWAYRSAGVAGLPRASGDEALAQLIAESPDHALAPLARAAREVPWKSRTKATLYGIFPGLPQLYLGEYVSGGVRLTVGLGALAAVVTTAVLAIERGGDLSFKHDWPLLVTGAVGLLVLSIDYTESYHDGIESVLDWNARAERAFEAAHPAAP
jgi:hypothetical protein